VAANEWKARTKKEGYEKAQPKGKSTRREGQKKGPAGGPQTPLEEDGGLRPANSWTLGLGIEAKNEGKTKSIQRNAPKI